MPSIPTVARQPPIAPLTITAFSTLNDLQSNPKHTQRLTRHLAQAATQLSSVAGQLIDRSKSYDLERDRKRKRAEANGELDHDGEAESRYADFSKQAGELTRKLDLGVRDVVDGQVWVQNGVTPVMGQMMDKMVAVRAGCQRRKGGRRNNGKRDHGDRAAGAGDDHHHEDEDDDEQDHRQDETQTQTPTPGPEENASAVLIAARQAHEDAWSKRTLTQRYSQHNTYIEFYRTVHDAHHPGDDVPPIPHHSRWFAGEEDTVNPTYLPPGTQSQRPRHRTVRNPSADETDQASEANVATPSKTAIAAAAAAAAAAADPASDSSDVEVAREKISLKCPITLLPFTEPLTSTKCPHSFEREPILEMITRSTAKIPPSSPRSAAAAAAVEQQQPRRRGIRGPNSAHVPAVHCPVCSTLLRAEDLRPDPVLVRRMERIRAKEKREAEEAEEAEEEEEEENARRVRRGMRTGRESLEDSSDDDDDVDNVEHGADMDEDGDDGVLATRGNRTSVTTPRIKREKQGRERESAAGGQVVGRRSSKSRAVSVVPDTQFESSQHHAGGDTESDSGSVEPERGTDEDSLSSSEGHSG